MRKLLACSVMALAMAAPAAASPIINGDFEANIGLVPPNWSVFVTIPGWTTVAGPGIEVEADTVVTAHSGTQYVELDSYSNSGMSQTVALTPGEYLLSFWYQPRTSEPGDNGIEAFFDAAPTSLGTMVAFVSTTDPPQNYWAQYSIPVNVAVAGNYNVSFLAVGDNNSLGGFIDDVSLDAVAPVPEPASLVLLGTGLVGAARRRRKQRANG